MTTPLGVVGAGTMSAGIAQLGCVSGLTTRLFDPDAAALARGVEQLERALARSVEKGRLTDADAHAARARLEPVGALDGLAGCGLAIEAAPERLELKQRLMADLARACGSEAALATNTSSLLVSAVAAGAPRPEQVVGMHFFNPAPAMRLVEVVAGERTGERAVAVAVATAAAMGRTVVRVRDGIGFLVNRCGRPFVGEANRLVLDGVADVATVDRVCRMAGGFRMGPFELADLIGVDVNHAIAASFHAQSFGEPRWKPSPLQARLVASGLHGRKTGRGFHDYAAERPADPAPPAPGGGDGRTVAIDPSRGPLASELRERAGAAGFHVVEAATAEAARAWLRVDADPAATARDARTPAAVLCAGRAPSALAGPATCPFFALAPLDAAVEIAALDATGAEAQARTRAFFAACGLAAIDVGDAPGGVLGRIVAQLVNEAAFALAEGIASPADVDLGMTLGLNHPRGPVAWSEAAGVETLLAILDGLHAELGDDRYRAAPLLRRLVRGGRTLRDVPSRWG
jgi:3-hydroxybutyryl-CoA dehydrogenase